MYIKYELKETRPSTKNSILDLWKENDSSYEFEFDIPGFSKNEINVSTKGHFINISTKPKEGNSRKSLSLEYKLPDCALVSATSASLDNGVLTVTVPKKENEKPTQILIK